MTLSFAHPWALPLLLLVPAYLLWLRRRIPHAPAIRFPGIGGEAGRELRAGTRVAWAPEILRACAFGLLVFALAGPRTGAAVVETETEGVAIAVAMDVSSSMLAEDFRPTNRLGVAKRTTMRFVQGRRHDRIGLIAFAGEALTQVPVTSDYAILFQALEELRPGVLEDGTAIGTGLAAAINRLRRVPGESRVIILLSDGENNRGTIDPRDAARAAAAYGIRVFTIGIGSRGIARVPVARTRSGVRYAYGRVGIDEELLRDVARITDGRYFRATDPEALERIYREIDALVRTPFRERRYVRYTPRAIVFLLLGSGVLLLEWWLRGSRWGRVP